MKTLTLSLFVLLFYNQALGKTIHVNELATGAKNGKNWEDAFVDLSNAIKHSIIGDSIWIANGYYTSENSLDTAFQFKDGVSVLGGFEGTEKSSNERKGNALTILTTPFTSYGFRHEGRKVGVIQDHQKNTLFNRLTFSYGQHVGLIIKNSNTTFTECSFTGNGKYSRYDSSLHNGAVSISSRSYNHSTFRQCLFFRNSGIDGGAMSLTGFGLKLSIINCNFLANQSQKGAAIYTDDAEVEVIGCLMRHNSADEGCCIFSNGSDIKAINCTFYDNYTAKGSVIHSQSRGRLELTNSIVWKNDASALSVEDPSTETIKARYSIIQGGYIGKNVLDEDPLFKSGNPSKLKRESPAFNGGDPKLDINLLPSLDLGRNHRLRHHLVDMGAYETQCETSEQSEWTRISAKSCGTYVAPSGTAIDSSGLHFDVIPNKVGCDSIILIDLTIQQPTSHVIRKKSCSPIEINGVNYDQSGTYTQTLTNAKGCDSTLTIELTIPRLNSDMFVQGRVLKAQMENASYQWINCDSNTPIPGATNQSYKVIEDGSYAVEVSNNDCTKRSSCVEIIISHLAEVKNQNFELYPNPFSHVLNVKRESNRPAEFKITTITGEDLISGTLRDQNSQIDLSEIPAGIYIMSIGSTTEYIVKSR